MRCRRARDGEKVGKCVFGCCVPSASPIRALVLRLCSVRADSAFNFEVCEFTEFLVIAGMCLILGPLLSKIYIILICFPGELVPADGQR